MSDFLYPFLSGEDVDRSALLGDLVASARAKLAASAALRDRTLTIMASEIERAAELIREGFTAGATMLVFGNGGSSTDAACLASLFAHPPTGTGFPARTLLDDAAVLTALGNDVGFDRVFSRQIIALGQPGDIAVGISTSGDSRNLLEAFAEARRREMVTIGIAGNDGGAMADARLDALLVVNDDSVHRVQETQAAMGHELWRRVATQREKR